MIDVIRELLSPIKIKIKTWLFSAKWRSENKHNYTCAVNYFPVDKVIVGEGTYGELRVLSYNCPEEKLEIGNYCSIANDVLFILGGEHNYRCISNYPFLRKFFMSGIDAICKGPIIVEDDVWIGARSTILSGVTLGKGCVVGAGSVVAKDIPPYAVFVNGKIVKYRFSEELISKIEKIDYRNLNRKKIKKVQDICHVEVNERNVDDLISAFVDNY